MGVIFALIVGPCVAAPLAGALLYISQTRDWCWARFPVLPGDGHGVPLLLVGSPPAPAAARRRLDGGGEEVLRRRPAGGGDLADSPLLSEVGRC